MDDDSFKTELLSRLERIQALLTYLCGAAKAADSRAKAEIAAQLQVVSEETESQVTAAESLAHDDNPALQEINPEGSESREAPVRSLLQEEMENDYNVAVQKWKAAKT